MQAANASHRVCALVTVVLICASCSLAEDIGLAHQSRQLQVRPRHREGRRTHNSKENRENSAENSSTVSAQAGSSQSSHKAHHVEDSSSQGSNHNLKHAGDHQAGSWQQNQAGADSGTYQHHTGVQATPQDFSSDQQSTSSQQHSGHHSAVAGKQQGSASQDVTFSKRYTDWDGQRTWEWDNPRTIYFEPVAGLGNRLRALASAVVIAREAGVGLKVIWREEVECGIDCGWMPPFNSTWPDLFSYPNLRLAPNFPGSNYSVHKESIFLRPNMSIEHPDMPPVVPGFNCTVYYVTSFTHFQELLTNAWTHVHGEEVLCVKSDLWLTKNGESDGKFFFRLLRPSPPVKLMLDQYKKSMNWDDKHFIGAHIRRTDLAIVGADGKKTRMDNLIPLSRYVDTLRKLTAMAPNASDVSYFIATDDAEAEKIIRSSFEDGRVLTFPKTTLERSAVEGIQEALVDVLLLAECPVLIGTYYSSYSEAAKLMAWPFYIQIGNELRYQSQESKFIGWPVDQ